jgi:hypothetical protein
MTMKPQSPTSSASDLFRKPKEERRTALTHDKIADDLAAFQRAGGTIEVLGTTHTLKSIPPPPTAAPAPASTDREGLPATHPAK